MGLEHMEKLSHQKASFNMPFITIMYILVQPEWPSRYIPEYINEPKLLKLEGTCRWLIQKYIL